jgi:hypothetical protein
VNGSKHAVLLIHTTPSHPFAGQPHPCARAASSALDLWRRRDPAIIVCRYQAETADAGAQRQRCETELERDKYRSRYG